MVDSIPLGFVVSKLVSAIILVYSIVVGLPNCQQLDRSVFCQDCVQFFFVMFPGYMRIKIPWKNLSTEQTVIKLEGVYVIIAPYLSTSFIGSLHFLT